MKRIIFLITIIGFFYNCESKEEEAKAHPFPDPATILFVNATDHDKMSFRVVKNDHPNILQPPELEYDKNNFSQYFNFYFVSSSHHYRYGSDINLVGGLFIQQFNWGEEVATKSYGEDWSQAKKEDLNFYKEIHFYNSNTNFIFKITNQLTSLFDIDKYKLVCGGTPDCYYPILIISNETITNSFWGTTNE